MRYRPKIILKKETIDRLLVLNDTNRSGLAIALRIDYSQLWRLENGRNVGAKVIAQILKNHPDHKFEDFFEVV